MSRLWVRLMLAFVAVTLVTVAVVGVLAGRGAEAQFRQYLAQRDEDESGGLGMGQWLRESLERGGRGPMRNALLMMRPLEQAFLNRLYELLVAGALVASVIGAVMGLLISRTIAAPLSGLARAARDIAARRWERRAPEYGADEVVEVARAFNAMADELQRAETLRRNLMADIAHELRTPLTVMQGNLRALLDGVYPLELREVATLYDQTRLLSRLVTDLRELALVEAGRLALNLQTVEMLPVLRGAVEQFSPVAEMQATAVELAETSLPPVQADPDRLAQVLHNLLANALRHTPGGQVRVSGEAVDGRVRITVSDTGEGIPSGDLPHIFNRFYRADDSRPGGTGLGLAIAKAWVEAMGGVVGVDSAPGQGSRFWFTLPASA